MMKNQNLLKKVCFVLLLAAAVAGCKESIDTSARYVFKYDTVLSYLKKHDVYSEYVKLLDLVPVSPMSTSTVAQLLSARGNYTVFAPTNDAIQEYLESLVVDGLIPAASWEAFTDSAKLDSIRKVVVYNGIIDGGDDTQYETAQFPEVDKAEFPLPTMNDHKLAVHYIKNEPDSIYINVDNPLSNTQRDILCLNGIIHQMQKVIAPRDITAADYIQEVLDEKREGYLTAFRVIQACGLMDTLMKIRDEVYEALYQRGDKLPVTVPMTRFAESSNKATTPEHRKYGFTLFLETDDFWRSQGLDPQASDLLPRLTQWILDNHQYSNEDVFVTDENYESEDHLLYQWITYHILPMKIPSNRLVFHFNEWGYNPSNPYTYSIPVTEYYTTMGKRRLFKLIETSMSDGVCINRFPKLDNGRRGSGREVECDANKVGCHVLTESEMAVTADIVNCNIYPIDAPLSYNDEVRDNLFRQRIRFDMMSIFPEAMNNDFRKKKSTAEANQFIYIPNTVTEYNYLPDMIQNEDAQFVYYNAYNNNWCNLNEDEMKATGRWEFTFRLPPVPRRGTYEVRYKVLANSKRGIGQLYFGDNPNNLPVAGIPLNLNLATDTDRKTGTDSNFGWERDTEDDDYNAEVDKRMHNNMVMKGSKSVTRYQSQTSERDYSERENVRRIFVRQTLDPNKTYYMKIKSVLDTDQKEFYMDYLEYCPKEVYDNPNEPEDIW